jgi:PAS domain S-box-containing protein
MSGDDGDLSLVEQHAFESGQREVLELIASGAPEQLQLERIVRLIEAQAPGMICSILLLDRDQGRLRSGCAPNLPKAFMRAIDGAKIGPNEGSCGSAAFRRERVIVDDIASHEYWKGYRELALPHGLRACWSSPIFSSTGCVLGTFAMYFNEVRTPGPKELHWVERATHITSIALQRAESEAQQRLQAHVFSIISDVIFYLAVEPDEQYRFLWINPAFSTATGLSTEQVVGQLVQQVIPAQSVDKVLGYYRQAIEEKRTAHWLEVSPYPTGTKYGEVSIAPVFTREGVCTNLIGTVHDVTEQHLAQQRAIRAQRLESLGEMVGGIAHDFNNILAAISANASFALTDTGSATWREAMTQIERASARGAELVKQMLTFSSKQNPERREVELPQIVDEALNLLRAAVPPGVQVRTTVAPAVPQVLADPTQAHQVVVNLITNAMHAMANGGQLNVEVDGVELTGEAARKLDLQRGTYARLRVGDTGSGMTEATLARIFDPFFTTKQPGIGTGLGLAMVHRIVQAHKGAITVVSTLGKGTTFETYFPATVDG